MKKITSKVVNLNEYKSNRNNQEINRDQLLKLIKQIAITK